MECSSFSGSLSSSVFSLGGAARAVIGLLHADMHQHGTVGSVGHLATSVITVAPSTKVDEAVAKITKRLKSGKVLQDVCISTMGLFFLHHCRMLNVLCSQEEVFSIKEDFTVTLQRTANQARPKQADPKEEEVQCYTWYIIWKYAEDKTGLAEYAVLVFPADWPSGQLDLQPSTVWFRIGSKGETYTSLCLQQREVKISPHISDLFGIFVFFTDLKRALICFTERQPCSVRVQDQDKFCTSRMLMTTMTRKTLMMT